MIKKIDMSDRKNAESILSIQILAYHIEAELIGTHELPPLKETIDSLQSSGETFYGFYEDKDLRGVISIDIDGKEAKINRLFVHPDHFKRRIAQSLLDSIEKKFESKKIKVATGSKNTPAIHFYQKNRFKKLKETLVDEELSSTFFEKNL